MKNGKPLIGGGILMCAAALSFTGCSSHLANEDFRIQVANGVNSADRSSDNTLEIMKQKENLADKNYIDVSSNISLKTALDKLGTIDGNIYYVPNGQNFYLPTISPDASLRLHIDSFRKLASYIKDTTPYVIEIVKNRFKYNAVKIVKVFNRKEMMYDLKKVPFEIKSPIGVADALREVCELTGFNIVYKNDFNGNEKLNISQVLDNRRIYFKGNNVFNFLKYISDMFDVYVDVDYDKKLITISKYKTKMFHLLIPDYNVNLQSGATIDSGANQNQNQQQTKTVQSSMRMQMTQKFISAIKELVNGDSGSKIVIDESGNVIVKTTKNNMETIQNMFEKYNNNFSKQVKLNFEVYNFLLNKNYNYGVDFSIQDAKNNFVTGYITNTIFSHSFNSNGKKKVNVNMDNNFIELAKKYTFNTIVVNNIPQEISFIDNKDYIKSIQTEVTTGTAATTQTTTTDIGTITQGQILTLLARIYGNKVFLKTEFEMSTLNNITEKQIGNNTITLPDVSNNSIPKTFILRMGEKRIVGYYESYQDASKYNGIIPLKGFIVGGNNNQQYVRVLTVIVVSVDKLKGNGELYGQKPPAVHRITID